MLSQLKILKCDSFQDFRGELWTIWKDVDTPDLNFNHDKVSVSKRNVIRGLHYDSKSWKVITCLYGKIQLVVVDMNPMSTTYLKHESIIIDSSSREKIAVLIPPSYANGHCVLSDEAVFYYKWAYEGEYPDVKDQISLRWDDPIFGIDWLVKEPIISDRDRTSKFL